METVCAGLPFRSWKTTHLAPIAVSRRQTDEKMEKNHHMLDMGGRGHVTIGSELGLERFQDQPKWEIPGKVNNNSFRRRNIDFFRQNVILVWRNLTRNP